MKTLLTPWHGLFKALVRDSYRCVVTGCGDYTEVSEMTPKERQKYNLDAPSLTFVTTDFCYIFSSSTNWNFNHNDSVDKKVIWFCTYISWIISNFWTYSSAIGPHWYGLFLKVSDPMISSNTWMSGWYMISQMDSQYVQICTWRLVASYYGSNTCPWVDIFLYHPLIYWFRLEWSSTQYISGLFCHPKIGRSPAPSTRSHIHIHVHGPFSAHS